MENKRVFKENFYTQLSKEQLIGKIRELEVIIEKLSESEINLIEKNKFLKEISTKDYLTEVYNYRTIIEVIKKQIEYSKPGVKTFSILMIDIDNFKSVNDKFGHVFGDEILIKICKEIKKNIRKNDYVGRYGGEEFIVIFDNTKLDEAIIISERIRKSIENLELFNSLKVTISGGIKEYLNENYKEIIEKADKLLYKAKKMGKNRICY